MNTSIAIVIDRPLKGEDHHYIEKLRGESDTLASHLSADLNDIPDSRKKEINEVAFDYLLELGERNIGDVKLRDLLAFDQSSWLFYHRFKIYFETRDSLYFKEQLRQLLESYDRVILFSNRNEESYCDLKNLEVIAGQKTGLNFPTSLIHYAFTATLRFLISIFQVQRVRGKKTMVIEHYGHYQNVLSSQLELIFENRFFSSFYEKLDSSHLILDHFVIQKEKNFRFNSCFFKNLNSRNRLFSEWIIGSYLINPKNWKTIFRIRKKHQFIRIDLLKKLAQETDLISKLILRILLKNVYSTMYFHVKYEAYKYFFSSKSLKVVLTIDENTPNNKAILDAAKFYDIYTIGYQHGSVHRLNPSYKFHQNDISYQPFPDVTLVWDDYWKNYLRNEANYPEENLKIIGQLKTDVIPFLKDSNLRQSFRRQFARKHIILFASQPIRDDVLEKRIITELFSVCADLKDVHLIFRPHPRELSLDWVPEIAVECGLIDYTIDGKSDLFLTLSSVDAVITYFSTVGMEARYFGAPLIIFDPLEQDPLDYVKNRIGRPAFTPEQLKKAIIESLEPNHIGSTQVLNTPSTIIDGKATERLLEEIQSHI